MNISIPHTGTEANKNSETRDVQIECEGEPPASQHIPPLIRKDASAFALLFFFLFLHSIKERKMLQLVPEKHRQAT